MTTEHHQWRCVLPSTGADSMAEDATMAEPAEDKATDGQILIEGTSSGLEYFLHPVRISFAADKRALFMDRPAQFETPLRCVCPDIWMSLTH